MNFYEDFQSRKKRKQDKDKLYKEVMQYVPSNASMIVRNEVDKAYGDKETYSKPKNLTVKEVPFQSQKSAHRYAEKQIRSDLAAGKLPTANRFDNNSFQKKNNTNRFEKRFDIPTKPTKPTGQTFRPLNPNNVYLNPKITPERMMRYGVTPQYLPSNPKPISKSSGGIKGKFQRNVVNPFINSILETQINREWSKEDRRNKNKIAELEKMKGKFYVPKSKGLFQTAVQGASGLGGQQLDQVRSAIPTAMAFAGGALALGQAGPQVALPEEAVTVPSAFATGLKAGVAKSAYQSEKGASYREQIESGVDPKKASYISTGVGAVNAGLEFIQFDKLLKGFKFAKAMNDLPAMKQIGLEIAKRTGDIAKETGQEVLQEGVSIAGANIGKKMSGIELDSKEDVKNRLKDTAVSSALSFGLMGVPGTVGSINNIARTPIQSNAQIMNPIATGTTEQNLTPNKPQKLGLDEHNIVTNTNTPLDNKLANTPQNLRQQAQSNNQANQTIVEPPEYVSQMKQYQAKEAEFNSLKEDMQNKSIPMKNRSAFKAMYEDDNRNKSYTFDKNSAWVGDKKVNAYVYENPILSGIYYKALNELELQSGNAIKGKRESWYDQYGELHYGGTKQFAEADMNYMLHDLGMSYKAINDGLSRYREFLEVLMSNSDVKTVKEAHDKLINANAKKVELALDNMLMGTMKDRETGEYYEDTLYKELRNIADEGQADEWFVFNQKPPQKPLPQVQNVETYTTKNVDNLSIDEQRVSNFAQRLVKSNIAPKVQFIETNQPGINGYYENGTIFINRNSSNPIMNVFAHEFTHHLQESKMYNDFRNFTINYGLEYAYGHNDIATLIQEKRFQYANAGIELSVTDAENELMAEYVEKYLLSDEEAINELARRNESLFYRIYAHIRDSIKLITGSEEERFLVEARRKYAKAIRNLAKERQVDLTRYLESTNMNANQQNDVRRFSLDDEYFAELENNNVNSVRKMVLEQAHRNGYDSFIQNPLSHTAPTSSGLDFDERMDDGYFNLFEIAQGYGQQPDDFFSPNGAKKYNYQTNEGLQSARAIKKVLQDIQQQLNSGVKNIKMPEIEVYRAIPKNLQSTLIRNGDWVTPSIDYAIKHGEHTLNGNYKILKEKVKANHLWWDANSINEWGVDDGEQYVYRDTKNNKKSLANITVDDSGNIIPLSNRFDSMNPDTRYSVDTSQIKNRSFQSTVKVAPTIHKDFAQSIQQEIDNGKFAYEVIHDTDSLARVNQAIQRNGLDKYLYNLESKLNEGKHLTKDDMVMGQRLIQEYIKAGDSERAMYAVTLTAEAGTQAGQAVQAMSMMRKLTPEGQLMALNRIAQKLTNEYVKPGEQEITVSKERAKDIMMSDTPERLEQAVERAKEDVYNQVPVTIMDKINAWRYLSMLGNLKTHIRNILGNFVFYPTRMMKNQIARGMESAFIKGEKSKSFLTPKDKGLVELGKYDYDMNESVIKGESKYADSKMMYNRKIFSGWNAFLEPISEFNFEWLEKEDNFFIKKVYANSFAGYLKANGITLSDVIDSNGNIKNSIEIGNANISNPHGTGILDNARRYATIEAQKATYRDESAIATWLTRQFKASQNDTLVQARNKAIGRFVVEAVIPFKKTPINVLKRGVEYSPVGLMDSLTLGVKQLKAGEITGTQLIDKISSGLTGTTLVGLGYALAHFGILKGRGDEEKEKEKAFSKLTGEQNYSFNIGDHSYTVDWVSPTALPLFVGVEAFEELNRENDKKNFDIVNSLGTALDVIGNVSDPVFSMSMVQGLTRTMKSYSSNDGGFVFDFLTNAMSQYAGQYVPTAFGQFNRTMYPTRYDTSSPRKGNAKVMQQTFNQIVSKVPFAPPRVLQPKVDVWGQEMLQEGDNWTKRLVQNMVSPGYYSNTKRGAREEEIFRLYKKNGNTDVLPPQIDKVKDVALNGETYTFNSKQRTQFLKTSGTYRKDLLDSLFASQSYKKASDEEKEKMIYNVYDYANQKAKYEIAKEFNVSYDYKQAKKAWIKTADIVGAKDYLQYRGVVGLLPDNEKGKSQKLKALSELGLSDEKTIAILKADFDNKKKSYSALVENGISIDDYLTVEEVRKNMRVPLNRKGNPITKGPYSKKAQTFRYINSLDLEPYQKKMLFEMYYDNKR